MGPHGVSVRVLAGYLAGIALGTMSITLLFLGMRAVMDVGGACADGGPYVSAQPCPTGVPLAMVGGMFGLFGSAGLTVWFGSRIGKAAASIVALGWPALFLSLGLNFLDYAFHPPDNEATPVWGWLIPGVLFWLMGGAPLAVGILAWREARAGRPVNRLSNQVAASIPDRPIVFGTRFTAPRPPEPARVEFAPGSWGATRPTPSVEPPTEPSDLVDDLTRLAELHEAGDLSDEEFATAKRDRLGQETRG
ncbi:MAG TPA: SHOCT domain-containing protein [Candidatus Limnocylindrales bacterium]|nr:SHOCT domain-containing protein [Candidatus Limnocylindrales bacterium]